MFYSNARDTWQKLAAPRFTNSVPEFRWCQRDRINTEQIIKLFNNTLIYPTDLQRPTGYKSDTDFHNKPERNEAT